MRNVVHAAILATVTVAMLIPFAPFLGILLLPGVLIAFAFYGSRIDSLSTTDSFILTNILGDFAFYMLFWYLVILVWRSRRRWKPRIVVAVVGILIVGGIVGGVVIPDFIEPRRRSQEMAVIQTVRSITTAQYEYHRRFGRFAGSLSELASSPDGTAGPSSAGLLPADFAGGSIGGYTYTLHSSPSGYTVNANPVKYGIISHRTFFSDETMTVRSHLGREPATAASGEVTTPIDKLRCPSLCGPDYH